MALTSETLVANEVLGNLTEEQISAIVTLSVNDEDVVISKRIGEIYREMDTTIETATGIKRDGAEKTYKYLKRATEAFVGQYADYNALKEKVTTLETEKAQLMEEVAKGGDTSLKNQLEATQKELTSTKQQFLDMKAKYDGAEAEHAKAMSDYKIDAEIAKACSEIKIKAGLSEQATATLVRQAVANIKAKNPSFVEKDGEQRLVFHDENGSPLNNVENKLNPFTAKELLIKEFEILDILDKRPNVGAGGKGNLPNGNGVLGASTQTEATAAITKALTEKGLVRGTSAFQNAFNEMWKEHNISTLPLR